MLSNRESARRSRMRKQRHLEELRAQVSHIRINNGRILTNFEILTQRYNQAVEENRFLKNQAVELSQQLQQLQQVIAASQSSAAAAPYILNALASHHHLQQQQQQHRLLNNNNIINFDVAVDTATNSLSQCSEILI